MDRDKKAALANALELLRKVRSDEETRFTKEDWQMLQVARFLVSKEKFIKRDADNITLYYAANKTFYFLDDLSDAVYTLAKYIYDNDPGLIIDTTKKVEYGLPLDPKYSRLTNPTMDEAIIIINMVRNAIAHGNAIIDFENSLLKIDNTMPSETDPNIIKFHMNVDIPISLLSKLDLANIVKKNRPKLEKQVMSAIANKDYIMQDDKVYLLLDYHGFEMRMGLSTKQFMDLYYYYDKTYKSNFKIDEKINEIDVSKYRNLHLSRKSIGKQFMVPPSHVDEVLSQKHRKDLAMIMELVNNTPEKVLDPTIVRRFLELAEYEDIPYEERLDALREYKKILESINFHNTTEQSIDSISFALGISDEEKSLDLIALYNYMTLLFAHYPLKEGNAMLTEFIDLSTIAVDMSNTRDIDISNFYKDVEKIMRRHLNKVNGKKDQYAYKMPCLTEYLRCITDILRKFKTRNNAYIRHIRNALEHSDIKIEGTTVELRDYIKNGDNLDKTFRSKISLNKLIELSAAYTFIYDIPTYRDYQNFVCDDQNAFLSFTFVDLFRELGKGIDLNLIKEFCEMLNELSTVGLGREFNLDSNVVDLVEELPYAISEAKKEKGKGPGSK